MQDGTVDPGRDRLRQGANLVAVLVSFGANTWSNVAPVGGMTVGDIANAFFTQVLVLPANYAFAIWGLIYVGLGAFAIYQFRTDQAANPRLRRLGYLLPLATLIQPRYRLKGRSTSHFSTRDGRSWGDRRRW